MPTTLEDNMDCIVSSRGLFSETVPVFNSAICRHD